MQPPNESGRFSLPFSKPVVGMSGMEAAEVFHLWWDTVDKSLVLAEPPRREPVETTRESAEERLDKVGDLEELPSLRAEPSSAFTSEADLGRSSADVTWTWRPRTQNGRRYLSWMADQISWERRLENLRRAAGTAMVDKKNMDCERNPYTGQP